MLFASAAVLMVGCEKGETIEFNEATLQTGGTASLDDPMSTVRSCLITFTGQFFIAEDYVGYYYPHERWQTDIACIGKVDGVSYINIIPGNWRNQVEVVVGNGYVARNVQVGQNEQYYRYYRFYVTDLVKDASGNILAVKYRYARLDL